MKLGKKQQLVVSDTVIDHGVGLGPSNENYDVRIQQVGLGRLGAWTE